ncbi:MAG: porin [Phycisphaerales bacterium]|nr:porin [Phycisphaerales bacterium]
MSTKIQQATATLALAAVSGLAMGQSGLDLDRAYASELRSDAQTRSSLLGSNNGANLNIEVMTQFRYTFNSRDEFAPGALGDSDTTMGFSTPRSQIRMSGAVEGTDISGAVIFDFGAAENGTAAGSANLLVAQGAWGLDDNWTLLFGQWHNPVLGSERFAAEHTLAADKSFTNEFFQVGYTQGVAVAYGADNFKFVGAISDGAEYITNYGTVSNSPFNSAGEADIGITGRFDFLVEGTWDQFADATSWRGSNYGLKIGAGAHWQTQGDSNPADNSGGAIAGYDDTTVTFWTVDAQVEGDGWNVFAEYVGHKVEVSATTDVEYTNHGFIAQGGYFFNDQWEGFARYDVIMLDDVLVAAGTDDNFQSVTVGANYYFVPESHAAKFTIDATFTLDESTNIDAIMGGAGSNDPSATGLLGLSDSEFAIRGQMTLVF